MRFSGYCTAHPICSSWKLFGNSTAKHYGEQVKFNDIRQGHVLMCALCMRRQVMSSGDETTTELGLYAVVHHIGFLLHVRICSYLTSPTACYKQCSGPMLGWGSQLGTVIIREAKTRLSGSGVIHSWTVNHLASLRSWMPVTLNWFEKQIPANRRLKPWNCYDNLHFTSAHQKLWYSTPHGINNQIVTNKANWYHISLYMYNPSITLLSSSNATNKARSSLGSSAQLQLPCGALWRMLMSLLIVAKAMHHTVPTCSFNLRPIVLHEISFFKKCYST